MDKNMRIVAYAVKDMIRKYSKKDPAKFNLLPFARLIEITQEMNLDGTDLQVMMKFCFEAGFPITFAELGVLNTEETLRYAAKRTVAGGYKRKGFKCDEQEMYLQFRKINSWGEKITGIRGPKQVAEEFAAENPEVKALLKGIRKTKVVFLGDSLMTTLHWGANAGYPDILKELFLKNNRKVEIINSGIGGHTSWQGLARLEKDVLSHKPEYCVILFGGNDMFMTKGGKEMKWMKKFRLTMEIIIKKLKTNGIKPVLLSGTVIKPFEPVLYEKEVVAVQKQLALRYNLGLIDTYSAMNSGNQDSFLAPDKIHLNNCGQKNMARLMLEWMAIAVKK